MESEEDSQISVWFCREEKLVSGLSRRTTCADVMRALLLEDQQQNLSGGGSSPRSCYCIVEKWRGFERILPHKTKILRLWSAWGEEQENVRFVLVKNEASKLPNHGPRSAEARVVLSKEHHAISKESVVKGTRAPEGTARATVGGFSTEGTARATVGDFSPEKQRRIVRKAFRKLDKINRKKKAKATTSRDTSSSAEKMETLVHLVISQDHAVRQQIQRIQELDVEIERCEAKVHFDRIKRHGVNYVQDTYLCVDVTTGTDTLCTGEGEELCSAVGGLVRFEEYVQRCEEVVQLQEQLTEHEALMEKVTVEIQEELNQRWMERRQNELSGKKTCERASSSSVQSTDTDNLSPGTDTPPENELLLEEERIKTQLDTSLYIGLRLNTDLEAIRNDLNLIQEIWGAREREITELLEKVTTLDMQEGTLRNEKGNLLAAETEVMCTLDSKTEWVEQARGLSKTCNVNDDDSSDTGLSSLHSQDSDNLPICESLV